MFTRGDIVVDVGGAERVYLRLGHYWTCSPNSSNWYPTDDHIQNKIDKGEAILVGNREDFI